jgi:predicted permease
MKWLIEAERASGRRFPWIPIICLFSFSFSALSFLLLFLSQKFLKDPVRPYLALPHS